MTKAATRQFVRERAGDRCEYCRLPAVADEWPFNIDHIVALVHGGGDEMENLCWSCAQCNLHKGTNFASIDPISGAQVQLFNPRTDLWQVHFHIEMEAYLRGRSPSGRATVRLLDMNGSPQLELRRELVQQNQYFP